jgi:Zn-dependent protease with chaperone function
MTKQQISINIPKLKKLEINFKRYKFLNILFLLMIILLDCFLIYNLVYENDIGFRIFYILNLSISFIIFLNQYKLIFFQKKINLRDLKNEEKIGKYSTKDLKLIINDITKHITHREKPNIYIIDSGEASAYTINSLIFNVIRPLNAIYLSRVLFYLLNENELKAIITHELGHFSVYIYPLHRVRFLYFILIGLLPVYSIKLFSINNPIFFMLYCAILIFGLNWIFRQLVFSKSKTLEHLSDYYAASRYCKLNIINGLLILSKFVEMSEFLVENILRRIKKNDSLSLINFTNILKDIQKKLPNKVIPKDELKKVVNNYFRSTKLSKYKKLINSSKRSEEEGQISVILSKFVCKKYYKLIDWNDFDFSPKDNRINIEEYPFLIKTLIDNPDAQLFDLVLDNKSKSILSSHPTVSDRILFLDKSGIK